MHTVLEVINRSTAYFSEKKIANARRQAEDMLCDILSLSRMDLYLNFERPLEEKELVTCRERLLKRGRGEPLQYIHGEVDFFGCKIGVSPDVLIPRQETEILVDKIAARLSGLSLNGKSFWDICCGSGCIGIAIKKRFPELKVTLSDLSPAALCIAKKNAEKNRVEIEFLEGDLLVPFTGRTADFIVSNPPYISEDEFEGLDIEVKNYEPKLALVSGVSGLEFYKRFSKDLPMFLAPGGEVFFEIGYSQSASLKELFSEAIWKKAEAEKDFAGHFRFFFLEKE